MKTTLYTFIVVASALLATTTQAQTISTYAGGGTAGYSGDNGPATAARLNSPGSSVMDAAGNLYIADKDNHRIRKVSAAGTITTIVGTGTSGLSGDGAAATAAQVSQPLSVAVDAAGNLYIADFGNSRIRKVSTSGIISTVAGTASGFSGDGAAATAAQINSPTDVAVDAAGNLFICDYGNNRIRKVNTSGNISTVAGSGTAGYNSDGISAVTAELDAPNGVCVDAAGNIFIADLQNNRIRKVNIAGTISTIAGTGVGAYTGDNGPATAAEISRPSFLTTDNAGNVYFSDMGNSAIRRIGVSGTIVTVAGSNASGYAGDGGPATAAKMRYPTGLSFDANGSLYVTEQLNHIVRKIAVATVTLPGANTVCIGATTAFSTATMEGRWTSSNTAVATVNATTGVVTGVSAGTATISFTMGLAKGTANVTVNDCTTGISEQDNNETLAIFPNPASGKFSVTLPSSITLPARLILTNSVGQTVTDIQVTSSMVTMDAHVPAGVYILSVISGNGQYRTKVSID